MKPPAGTESKSEPVTVGNSSSAIVDNVQRKVGVFLDGQIGNGSKLSIVSAYFTIYAYGALRDALERVGSMRFLYGEPRSVGSMDPVAGHGRAFRLNEDGGISLRHALIQKPLARDCADWILRKVDIRTIRRANLLHGKLYHIAHGTETASALVGSSNLTRRGLGLGTSPNIEINLEVRNAEDQEALLCWFDDLWDDSGKTRDAKQDVLEALGRLSAPYSPEFIYYKTLFHVFEELLRELHENDRLADGVHLHDSEIWRSLYRFQRDGATVAINRLLRHNGCIIADSVGLGKTWTALAVIKYFELRNERVLVLCPNKLKANWIRYAAWANHRNNPFEKDRFSYTVLAHTDLSRTRGLSGHIDLAEFNWGAFDLVVIDESHNFRNEGRDRTNDTGCLLRSRYNRLLEEVIRSGARTKVLMLSATPVNTSLRDLRNQIYLMTEKNRAAFRETLGICDIQSLFGVAQREFTQWEQDRRAGRPIGKDGLIEQLGTEFLMLLDAVTIARSRAHIRRFYPEVTAEIGGFPERAPPVNLYPGTDRDGSISYDDLHEQIGALRLAIYTPSEYVRDKTTLDEERRNLCFDQRDREHFLIGMMRVNLLKRLESSVRSFTLTMGRIIDKVDEIDCTIERWLELGEGGDIETAPDRDEEDEEFTIGVRRRYLLNDLDVDRWREDLRRDRAILAQLRARAEQVTVERDAKLIELRKVLAKKVDKPSRDKDGHRNRKALVFTTFSDTARYLYDHLRGDPPWNESGIGIALVTGDGNSSTNGSSNLSDILSRFAPKSQQNYDLEGEIDILVATDCLSEGQNLQDCDLVINYDIHWNPVALLQRLGRIDRLGSNNPRVHMTNFWPTENLERYLDLRNRVEARMALADAAATGRDDPLSADADMVKGTVQGELRFRDGQLMRLRDEVLDIEEAEDGISIGDLTLDDFLADLQRYMERNRSALESAPFGISAVVDEATAVEGASPPSAGVIFCLRQVGELVKRTLNPLQPWFLVHVRADGTVRYSFRQARQCLVLFRGLAAGLSKASSALEDAFDRETDHGRKMDKYDRVLEAALRSIASVFRSAERQSLGTDRGAVISKASTRPEGEDSFELVTWLVILEKGLRP